MAAGKDAFERETDEFMAKIERDKAIIQRNKLDKEIKAIIEELKIDPEQVENLLLKTYGTNTTSELTDGELEKFHQYVVDYKTKKTKKEPPKTTDDSLEAAPPTPVPAEDKGKEEEVKEIEPTIVPKSHEFVITELEDGTLRYTNGEGNGYIMDISKPSCTCPDFKMNKRGVELCKHLQAAKDNGYEVAKLPQLSEETKAIVKRKHNGGDKRKRGHEEDTVAISYMDESINMPVQVPSNIIESEDMAAKLIMGILGEHPRYQDVIERFGDVEEIAADVILSLAQATGLRFTIISKEVEKAKINLGKVYREIKSLEPPKTSQRDVEKARVYDKLVELMPDTDVTVRCKVTGIAAWRDSYGGLHVGTGTKEEHITVSNLRDIATRGVNFVETTAETKAFKKAIGNALPITHDGLLQKIKQTYGWQ
jgi:predicted nucleic acid-binding Zn finger protein